MMKTISQTAAGGGRSAQSKRPKNRTEDGGAENVADAAFSLFSGKGDADLDDAFSKSVSPQRCTKM